MLHAMRKKSRIITHKDRKLILKRIREVSHAVENN